MENLLILSYIDINFLFLNTKTMFDNISYMRVRTFSYIQRATNHTAYLALYLSFPINTEISIQNKTGKTQIE